MRTTITDPRLLDASSAQVELSLLFLYDEENEFFERIESILGTLWTRDEVAQMFGGETDNETVYKVSDRARYPLSLLIRPQLIKELQNRFDIVDGEDEGMPGMGHIPKNTRSLWGDTKEEFMRKMGHKAVDKLVDDGSPNNRIAQQGFVPTLPRRLGR